MKYLLLLISSLCLLRATAQHNYIFAGGVDDGAAIDVAEIPSQNRIFGGGAEDGGSISYTSIQDNHAIFAGGNEDGYARVYFSLADNNPIFGGGNEDGYASLPYSQADNSRIFGGGVDDGGSALRFSSPDNNGIFAGGIDDGAAHFYALGLPSRFPAPFAVELLRFEAIPLQGKVQLLWTTLSEVNHDHFLLERSPDLQQIEQIAQLPGQGSPDLPASYESWDYAPLSGRSYYRLMSVDINGEATASQWVEVHFAAWDVAEVQAFPNPTTGLLTLLFQQHIRQENLVIQLYDLHGREIPISLKPHSDNAVQLDMSPLTEAFYLIRIFDKDTQLQTSLRIQKK